MRLAKNLDNDPDEAKYGQYTLPGGENYREVLLHKAGDQPALKPRERIIKDGRGIRAKPTNDYYGPHFDEPNILAHLRLKDRVDTQGKKTLFIEEAQSDWAHDAAEAMTLPSTDRRSGTPNAAAASFPLGNTWHELALKYALKEAAEGGYDQLAWTTGQQQAERYDLAKAVDRLDYNSKMNGKLVGFKNGRVVFKQEGVDPEELPNYIGKDLTARLLHPDTRPNPNWPGSLGSYHSLKLDSDLSIGGQHHKALYDQMLPQFLNRYTKRWGGKVGEAGPQGPDAPKQTVTVHALPLTPELKAGILKGQPLFGNNYFAKPDFSAIPGHVEHK